MKFTRTLITVALAAAGSGVNGYAIQPNSKTPSTIVRTSSATVMQMTTEEDAPNPTSFREAEILGLRLMQEGKFQEALVGT